MKIQKFIALLLATVSLIGLSNVAIALPTQKNVHGNVFTSYKRGDIFSSNRLGLSAGDFWGKNANGNPFSGTDFSKTSINLNLDLVRYETPIGKLHGETSVGVLVGTHHLNLQPLNYGPEVNYSMKNYFIGVAYIPVNHENRGEFIIGHRL